MLAEAVNPAEAAMRAFISGSLRYQKAPESDTV
jgi:hypothetical protein